MNIKGVDLSHHQGTLKIKSVKDTGYNFAILRGGYTGYGINRSKNIDRQFERFYSEAKAIGFPVGCYWYSCATNYIEGKAEAEMLYNYCLKGKQFEYPIYIDVEDIHWQNDKKAGVTDAIIGFCETLENLGYFVGVYASFSWFNNKIETSRLSAYTKWVAAWRTVKPDFKYNGFDLWQNSDLGKINGISGVRVDTNIAYVDFPAIIKKAGLNGFSKLVKPVYHTVEGDTLEDIAKKYNTTVDALIKLNDIKDNKLYIGEKIRIS